MKSPVERLNEIKEIELKKKLQQIADGEILKEADLRALTSRKSSYSRNAGDKARTNKGPAFTDRDF